MRHCVVVSVDTYVLDRLASDVLQDVEETGKPRDIISCL